MRKRFNEKNLVELHQFQIKANKYAHGASKGEKKYVYKSIQRSFQSGRR